MGLDFTSSFLTNTIDLSRAKTPLRPVAYLRISEDTKGLERGVNRQDDDVEQKRKQLGWPPFVHVFRENDTSAFKKKKLTGPDGAIIWRVIRPCFAEMLRMLTTGEADGVIVYDLDRLARQPRDLADLSDIVQHMKVPVQGISAEIDLLTPNGRMMAGFMVNMALKSSEDTSRRVARAAVDDAKRGTTVRGGPRRYGWERDGVTLVPAEADVIREMAARIIAGETVNGMTMILQERGLPTVGGKQWSRTAVNTIMRSPRLAGIRAYQGLYHGEKPTINDWQKRVVRVDGEYVIGAWQPILSVEDWIALQNALDGRGIEFARKGGVRGLTHQKHLLSGLCRCGACGFRMVGRKIRGKKSYGCPGRDVGGCNGVSRNLEKVNERVLELAIRRLRDHGRGVVARRRTAGVDRGAEIAALEERKKALRLNYAAGRISDDDFYDTLKVLDELATEHELARAGEEQIKRLPNAKQMHEDLLDETVSVERKRAIMTELIEKVVINKSSRGPHFSIDDIEIHWRAVE